jgi:hypothetical protein
MNVLTRPLRLHMLTQRQLHADTTLLAEPNSAELSCVLHLACRFTINHTAHLPLDGLSVTAAHSSCIRAAAVPAH